MSWEQSGKALARMARTDGLELKRIPKSLVNDVMLATSCREAGVTLITENSGDFTRIRRFIRFQFVEPWPA